MAPFLFHIVPITHFTLFFALSFKKAYFPYPQSIYRSPEILTPFLTPSKVKVGKLHILLDKNLMLCIYLDNLLYFLKGPLNR